MEREHFALIGIDTYSGYRFAFPAHLLLPKLPWTHRMPNLHHGTPHSIALDQGTHVTANEMQQWVHAHGVHWSYHHPETAGLMENWNGLLETQ